MKKKLFFAFVSAIALSGAVGITSCSSSDEVIDNPTVEKVKTQFTISLPSNSKAQSRMPDATVIQSGTNFTGIENIKLIPYTGAPGDGSSLINMMDLASITAFDYETSNTKVYSDVQFTPNVDHFIFYGKSIAPGSTNDFSHGKLTVTDMTTDKTLADLKFCLTQAYDATNESVGTALIAALNAVADATPLEANGTTPATAEHTWDKAAEVDGVQYYKFHEITSDQNATLNSLATLYKSLNVCSSNKVKLVLRAIYSNLDNLVTTAAFTSSPKAATMAMGIRKVIEAQFAGTVGSSELKAELNGYPANCNIPDGAARVAWDGTTTNHFVEANAIGDLNVAAKTNYVYPADLRYWVNSTILTSDNTQSDNYTGKTWDGVKSLYSGGGTAISATTRSVLIENPIQFAVANLETKVRLKNDVTVLTDNTPTTPASITIPTGGYELTGILLGNQKNVNWQFLPIGTETAKTIYDNSVKAGIKTVYCDASVPANIEALTSNYTLVLETQTDAATYIALEFQNPSTGDGGSDFICVDGTVRAGDKFYLVASLTPSSGNKVFTQDYTTRAVFTLPDNALAKAYNGLPDLRTPQMELGLSVDLTWKPGTTYNVEF